MDSINMCYEMCDYIEQNGIVKLAGNIRLRDNLKKEFLHFLIYISMIDGRYGEQEKAFIKKKLGFEVSKGLDTLRFVFNNQRWMYASRKNQLVNEGAVPLPPKQKHCPESG